MPTTHGPTPRQIAFGDRVRERRAVLGMSQEALALKSAVNRSYMASLENGRRNPSLETMCRLAAALQCGVSDLVDGLEAVQGRS